jgi:hypothetical protein
VPDFIAVAETKPPSAEVHRPMDPVTLRRFCQLMDGLHVNDRAVVLAHLASLAMNSEPRTVTISDSNHSVFAFLVPLGEYTEITATPEERIQLDAAIGQLTGSR